VREQTEPSSGERCAQRRIGEQPIDAEEDPACQKRSSGTLIPPTKPARSWNSGCDRGWASDQ
jgi:hypothetical protein